MTNAALAHKMLVGDVYFLERNTISSKLLMQKNQYAKQKILISDSK